MANNVKKVNGIAIASIGKINGQNDSDLAKLNGEEFTGFTPPTMFQSAADFSTSTGDGAGAIDDTNYKVIKFESSGFLRVSSGGTVAAILMVAGGGGSGTNWGGGGGAGGLL